MPKFNVAANNGRGRHEKIVVSADTKELAATKVNERGWKIEAIDEVLEPTAPEAATAPPANSNGAPHDNFDQTALLVAALLRDKRVAKPLRQIITRGVGLGIIYYFLVITAVGGGAFFVLSLLGILLEPRR